MTKSKLIIYTDGGARPNPGNCGFGVHMVLGLETDKPVTILGKYYLTTQGFILKNILKNNALIKQELKYLNVFPSDKESNSEITPLNLGPVLDIYGSLVLSNTNNHGELDAVIIALKNLDMIITKDYEVSDILFLIDSSYVLGYMKKIMLNILDLDSITANVEKITELKELLDDVSTKYNINLAKVKAHAGDLGNEKADNLATMGLFARNKSNSINDIIEYIKVDKDYFKDVKIDFDLFPFKQIFTFSLESVKDKNTYYGLNYKDITDIGRKINSVSYTIVKTKKPNAILNKVTNIVDNTLGSTRYPYLILMNNLTNKTFLREYLRYGENYITIKKAPMLTIDSINNDIIAKILLAPGLSVMVIDKFINLEYELDNFVNNTLSKHYETFDITDLIYYTEKEKTKILPEFVNDKHILKFKYSKEGFNKTTIRLHSRLDLPNRNKLKRYESLNPKVYLITFVNKSILEYKTVIVLNNEDYIYTSNVYSNKVFLKYKK